MGEMESTHHQTTATGSSRRSLKFVTGEIVEVQGGHIVCSTGRKDRHSKVCTAKGLRDRRVRLAAHTAIQFYDVQDRLGYDRPSKAVDWLIKKAKTSIDELAKLPAWNPNELNMNAVITAGREDDQEQPNINEGEETLIGLQSNSSSFIPPPMDTDLIADTVKPPFPTCGAKTTPPSTIDQLQAYPPDLLSRTSSQNQDLRLSLQFVNQDQPILVHHHHQQTDQTQIQDHHQNEHVLFTGSTVQPGGFDGNSAAWTSQHQNQLAAEISRLHKFIPWNNASTAADTGGSDSGSGGFFLNSQLAPPPPPLPPFSRQFFGESQLFSQRGPLQSSNTPIIHAWIDPLSVSNSYHHQQNYQIPPPPLINQLPSSFSGSGFGSFSGFDNVPDRGQAEEDQHDGFSHDNKPPSANSYDSRH